MRWSEYLLPTLKEDPADAQIASHRLMIRAGLIRKEATGIYSYLPAGFKVLRKIENIIQEEMDRSGAYRVMLPILTSAHLWQKSGRWNVMGKEMVRLKDRHENDYALGPTHEESITNMVGQTTFSYRDLPLNLYQMHTKFRDEIRPRFGVMRSREFIMKDAYSFAMDEAGLDKHYQQMRKTYRNIFLRVGLETIPVQADVGAMGGSASEEFMILSSIGEEIIIHCPSCQYTANQEEARRRSFEKSGGINGDRPAREIVDTPSVKSISELVQFFGLTEKDFLKSVVYNADQRIITVFIRGDLEINEIKLKNYLKALDLVMAQDAEIREELDQEPGFIGPIQIKGHVLFDHSVLSMENVICGAGHKDRHYKNVVVGRDFEIAESIDLHKVQEGHPCPVCGHALIEKPGIELGHIFKLGKKYTRSMGVTVLDEKGKEVQPLMGCYGIGVNRTMAAVIEQHHDDNGILWPISVAPFEIGVTSFAKKADEITRCDSFYETLLSAGFDVLYDDRPLSPGIKFKDMDLVGIPISLVLGKNFFQDGSIEIRVNRGQSKYLVASKDAIATIQKIRSEMFQSLRKIIE